MISLIVGDAILSDSFLWDMAKIQLKFSSDAPESAKSSTDIYKPKPEIKVSHINRVWVKRDLQKKESWTIKRDFNANLSKTLI